MYLLEFFLSLMILYLFMVMFVVNNAFPELPWHTHSMLSLKVYLSLLRFCPFRFAMHRSRDRFDLYSRLCNSLLFYY